MKFKTKKNNINETMKVIIKQMKVIVKLLLYLIKFINVMIKLSKKDTDRAYENGFTEFGLSVPQYIFLEVI